VNRREFFLRGIHKLTDAALESAAEKARENARRWIRPPYAIDELDFLLACTRCDKCIEACPHQVIFPLTARLGFQVAETPALDLLNKGCHLCEDWPCVTACEPGALLRESPQQPDDEEVTAEQEENTEEVPAPIPLPKLANASVDTVHCLPYNGPECGACKGVCPVPQAMAWEREKPQIDPDLCVGCGLCREACIFEPKAITLSR